MRMKLLAWTILGAAVSHCAASADNLSPAKPADRRVLTVWLMPNEPANMTAATEPKLVASEVKEFNEGLGEEVVVANTSDPFLLEQLLAWNPEFAVPNWRMLRGQGQTVETLRDFAHQHGVRIRVLFVTWSQAYGDLREALDGGGASARPDVAQVGSTWTASLRTTAQLATPSQAQAGSLRWRSGTGLRYIEDVRLLYYWKRLPSAPQAKPDLDFTGVEDWDAILKKLADAIGQDPPQERRPPMAIPIGFGSPNLLHDYVPLIWAGGGSFLQPGSTHVNLTSETALRIPRLLAERATAKDAAGYPYRILAFPEVQHQEAIELFVKGHYSAIIEPVGFLPIWHARFKEAYGTATFWDHAGLALLPATFKGGSDLVVTAQTDPDNAKVAFALARHLASSPKYVALLARQGHLPAQSSDLGIETLRTSVGASEGLAKLIRKAVRDGREYPELATWATEVESRDVIESMQRLWRRIGEGGPRDRIQHAAEEAERAINLRIDPWTQFLQFLATYGVRIAGGVLVVFAGLWYIHRKQLSARDQLIILHNDILRRRAYVLESRAGEYLADAHHRTPAQLMDLSRKLADALTATHRFEADLRDELRRPAGIGKVLRLFGRRLDTPSKAPAPMSLSDVVNRAWDIALKEYDFAYPQPDRDRPELVVPEEEELANWQLSRFPCICEAVLQQWMYNSLKEADKDPSKGNRVEVSLLLRNGRPLGLKVLSSPLFIAHRVECMTHGLKVAGGRRAAAAAGPAKALELLCELSLTAFSSQPDYHWIDNATHDMCPPEAAVPTRGKSLMSAMLLELPIRRHKGGKP